MSLVVASIVAALVSTLVGFGIFIHALVTLEHDIFFAALLSPKPLLLLLAVLPLALFANIMVVASSRSYWPIHAIALALAAGMWLIWPLIISNYNEIERYYAQVKALAPAAVIVIDWIIFLLAQRQRRRNVLNQTPQQVGKPAG